MSLELLLNMARQQHYWLSFDFGLHNFDLLAEYALNCLQPTSVANAFAFVVNVELAEPMNVNKRRKKTV